MSWMCSGRTHFELVSRLYQAKILPSERVAEAMSRVDRAHFVGESERALAHADRPLPIGYSATISAPHMHAYALKYLEHPLKPGAKVLDVGSGSGYLAVVMALLVQPNGIVVGIEHVPELVAQSQKNVRNAGFGSLLDNGSLIFVQGDGRQGFAEHAPYDAIHIGAACTPKVPPSLLNQMRVGGTLIGPEGGETQQQMLQIVRQDNEKWDTKALLDVRYVPLTDLSAQLSLQR